MAITISNSFITQFSADVKHDYQLESKLYAHVRKRTGVVGSDTKFQRLGAIAAYSKTRNADLTVLEPAHSQVTVTLADKYATVLCDDLDLLKTSVDIKREYVKVVSKALAKAQDEIILAALAAGSITATTNSGPLTIARLTEIKRIFDNNAVDASDRIMVIGGAGMEDLLGETKVTSSDYANVKALVMGDVDTFMGFKFVQVPDAYLTLNTTPTPDTRLCFAFHKDALGVAVGSELRTSIEWSPDKHAWWVKGVLSMGAGIVDTTGVLEFEVDI